MNRKIVKIMKMTIVIGVSLVILTTSLLSVGSPDSSTFINQNLSRLENTNELFNTIEGNNQLQSLAVTNGWIGTGTNDDPICVCNNTFNETIEFRSINLYITIADNVFNNSILQFLQSERSVITHNEYKNSSISILFSKFVTILEENWVSVDILYSRYITIDSVTTGRILISSSLGVIIKNTSIFSITDIPLGIFNSNYIDIINTTVSFPFLGAGTIGYIEVEESSRINFANNSFIKIVIRGNNNMHTSIIKNNFSNSQLTLFRNYIIDIKYNNFSTTSLSIYSSDKVTIIENSFLNVNTAVSLFDCIIYTIKDNAFTEVNTEVKLDNEERSWISRFLDIVFSLLGGFIILLLLRYITQIYKKRKIDENDREK